MKVGGNENKLVETINTNSHKHGFFLDAKNL